jgi:hypothetical protein
MMATAIAEESVTTEVNDIIEQSASLRLILTYLDKAGFVHKTKGNLLKQDDYNADILFKDGGKFGSETKS